MGEEAKQEEVEPETKPEEKPGEKKEEKAEEKKDEKAEEKKEEPKPPSPVVLYVDLHCVGCAKKIERSLMRIRGVEAVAIDMAQNHITVKGVVDPQALCTKIQKKTNKRATILSPLPAAEGEPTPQLVPSQVNGLITVELNVNMHCEACAQQLKRKILKMRGVQTAEADSYTSKVTVTGTMDAQRLVDYVYRRTKKQARIVPQPQPNPEPKPEPEKGEEKKEEGEKPAEEPPKPEENKEENAEKKVDKEPEEEKKNEESAESKEGNAKEEKVEESKEEHKLDELNIEERNARMMYYYPPLYVIERIPPPQIFSDENPNACCIS